jgi:hypothetical protein
MGSAAIEKVIGTVTKRHRCGVSFVHKSYTTNQREGS